MTIRPVTMTYAELADVLQAMADAVRAHDSLEGNIEYLLPDPYDTPDQDPDPDTVCVRASFRFGNADHGQGFVRIIGDPTPTPTPTP